MAHVQRREIQGLRAVAVVLVVLFHLWPKQVTGGYVGVDVFFVISGYLITSLLLREVDRSGTVSLHSFWARRMRRLLPAAYLVLVVSAVGVLLLEPRAVWPQFFKEILGAGFYVVNWTLALDSVDYLQAANTPSPVQHYWTLSAEEQFYVLWPLLVLLGIWWARRALRDGPRGPSSGTRFGRGPSSGTRFGSWGGTRGRVFAVLVVAVASSFGYSLWITAHDAAWAYFVTPARAWEFGAGALLAFAPVARGRPVARAAAGWAGLVALVTLSFVFDAETPMPGTAAIAVVLASAAVIWVGDPPGRVAHSRLLGSRPAHWVGDVSYSVYLWHWPLIILLPGLTGHPLTLLDRLSVLLATFGLAAVTKVWVEDPVRRARRFGLARSRTTFTWAAVAAVLLAVLCVVPRQAVLRETRVAVATARSIARHPPPCFGAAAMARTDDDCPNPALAKVVVPEPEAGAADTPPYAHCYYRAFRDATVPCRFGKPSKGVPHVAVIGDSHARVLMTMVQPLVDQGKLTADMFVMGECAWSTTPPDLSRKVGRSCARWRAQLYPHLLAHASDYDLILTTARLATLRGSHDQQVAGLSAAWRRLTDAGVPVAVLRDNPGVGPGETARNPDLCLEKVPVDEANERCAFSRAGDLDRWYDALSEAQRRTPGTTLVDLTHLLCGSRTCPVVIGGALVYSDGNHLTATFARTMAPYLYQALRSHGLLAPTPQKS